MRFTEFALGLGALAFAFFGFMLLANPQRMGTVGIIADNPDSRAEIRAMYGGLELGIAVFLALSLFRDAWVYPALMFQLLTLSGLGAGRLIGIALERGRVGRLLWLFAAIEIAAAVITYGAVRSVN